MLGVMNTRTADKLIKFSHNFKSYCNYFSVVDRHTTSNPCAFISTFKSANPFTQQLKGESPPSKYYPAEKRGAKHRYFCNSSGPTKFVKNGTEVEEELTSINKGDIVNLSQLLFTKNRDYLIKCNTGQRVKAGQLLGKVVVLYFDSVMEMSVTFCTSLMHIYKELQPSNNFEVVFIAFNDTCGSEILYYEDMVSRMPWTTIPLSDITCRKHLKRRFGLPDRLFVGYPIIVDPTGMILQCFARGTLLDYGALGYPFSDRRLDFLKSEDAAVARQPSLHTLLASSKRDYLISNNGDQVPIHTLEDKVVALYFYEEGFSDDKFTEELKAAYKELAKNNKEFEVVLIYRFDGLRTWGYKSDDSFWKTLKKMPWLALPYDDSHHRMLKRIFNFPYDYDGQEFALVIIGPRMEFIEPFGVFILQNYKILAYPFSRARVAQLIAEEARELRLEMLWDPNSVFGGKFGSEVLFSQIAGKRVLFFFDWGCLLERDAKFLETLKERYIHMKGTYDEFEVIHITELCSKTAHVANLPWFVLPLGQDYDAFVSTLFDPLLFRYRVCTLLIAFDQDGTVIRKTYFPSFEDIDFPFHSGDLEKEASSQLVNIFGWDMDVFTDMIYSYKQEREKEKEI